MPAEAYEVEKYILSKLYPLVLRNSEPKRTALFNGTHNSTCNILQGVMKSGAERLTLKFTNVEKEIHMFNECNHAISKLRGDENHLNPSDFSAALQNAVDMNGFQLFAKFAFAKLQANFEWLEEEPHPSIQKILYCGTDFKRWGVRKDSIVYRIPPDHTQFQTDNSIRRGILEDLLVCKGLGGRESITSQVFVKVRKLFACPTGYGNTKICREFKFQRYKYFYDHKDVDLEAIPAN